ncbi:MAG: hypothetical protein R3Y28_04110 [Candidatus Gastranaerophilales bacterium]
MALDKVIEQKIQAYIAKDESLKILPQSEVISIMVKNGALTSAEANQASQALSNKKAESVGFDSAIGAKSQAYDGSQMFNYGLATDYTTFERTVPANHVELEPEQIVVDVKSKNNKKIAQNLKNLDDSWTDWSGNGLKKQLTKLNKDNVVEVLNEYDKISKDDKSLTEYVTNLSMTSASFKKEAVAMIYNALILKADELGLDVNNFKTQYAEIMAKKEYVSQNSVNKTDTLSSTDAKSLDILIRSIKTTIENAPKVTVLEDVTNIDVDPVISEIMTQTGKQGTIDLLRDRSRVMGEELQAQLDYDGWAGKTADAVSILWGSGNRASVVQSDLDAHNQMLDRLQVAQDLDFSSKPIIENIELQHIEIKELQQNLEANFETMTDAQKMEAINNVNKKIEEYNKSLESLEEKVKSAPVGENFEKEFEKEYGIKYDANKVELSIQQEQKLVMAQSIGGVEYAFNKEFADLLTDKPLGKTEVPMIYDSSKPRPQAEMTNQNTYLSAELKLAQYIGGGDTQKGMSAINDALKNAKLPDSSKVSANEYNDAKYEVLRNMAKTQSKTLHNLVNEMTDGLGVEGFKKKADDHYYAAFGTKNDMAKRVSEYNHSQQVGAGAVKMGVNIGLIIASGLIPGGQGASGAMLTNLATGVARSFATGFTATALTEGSDVITSKSRTLYDEAGNILTASLHSGASLATFALTGGLANLALAPVKMTAEGTLVSSIGLKTTQTTAKIVSEAAPIVTGGTMKYAEEGEFTLAGQAESIAMLAGFKAMGKVQAKVVDKIAKANAMKAEIQLSREALGIADDVKLTAEVVKKAFRETVKTQHSDKGGNAVDMGVFTGARDLLMSEPVINKYNKAFPKFGRAGANGANATDGKASNMPATPKTESTTQPTSTETKVQKALPEHNPVKNETVKTKVEVVKTETIITPTKSLNPIAQIKMKRQLEVRKQQISQQQELVNKETAIALQNIKATENQSLISFVDRIISEGALLPNELQLIREIASIKDSEIINYIIKTNQNKYTTEINFSEIERLKNIDLEVNNLATLISNEKMHQKSEVHEAIKAAKNQGVELNTNNLQQDSRMESLKQYIDRYPENKELISHLYDTYYLADKPQNIKDLSRQLAKEYGSFVFVRNFEDIAPLELTEQVYENFKTASNGKAEYPACLDFTENFNRYINKEAGGVHTNNTIHATANKEVTLMHEIIHQNDKMNQPTGDLCEYKELNEILQGKYTEELRNMGMSENSIKYASQNRAEYIAKIVTEADLSKCSPEFKEVLINHLGMPEWAFNLKTADVIKGFIETSSSLKEGEVVTKYFEGYGNIEVTKYDGNKYDYKIVHNEAKQPDIRMEYKHESLNKNTEIKELTDAEFDVKMNELKSFLDANIEFKNRISIESVNKYNIQIINRYLSDEKTLNNENLEFSIKYIFNESKTLEQAQIANKFLSDERLYDNENLIDDISMIISICKTPEQRKIVDKFLSNEKLFNNTTLVNEIMDIIASVKTSEQSTFQINRMDEIINESEYVLSSKTNAEIEKNLTELKTKTKEELAKIYETIYNEKNSISQKKAPTQNEIKIMNLLESYLVKINEEINLRRETIQEYLTSKEEQNTEYTHFESYVNNIEEKIIYDYYDRYKYNNKLRKGADASQIDDVVILDKVFDKVPALKEDAIVYRAVSSHPMYQGQEEFMKTLKEGTIITDESYVSTSTDSTNRQFRQFFNDATSPDFSDGMIMRIKLPKGTKGIYGGHYEFLLPRHSQIKINKIEIIGGTKVADCEYILTNNEGEVLTDLASVSRTTGEKIVDESVTRINQTSKPPKNTAKARKTNKYSNKATEVKTFDNNSNIDSFSRFINKDIETIPVEDCIELQKQLTKEFRNGSIGNIEELQKQLPFLSNDAKAYLNLMQRLEQRINENNKPFNIIQIRTSLKSESLIDLHNSLNETDVIILDFINSLSNKSLEESNFLINSYADSYGLTNDEQIRLSRILGARHILQENTTGLTESDMKHIAYRLKSSDDLKLFAILEPSFIQDNKTKLIQYIREANKYSVELVQTNPNEIFKNSEKISIGGYTVQICDIDKIDNLSGFFHTPESYGDGMWINKVENDIYRRFGNFQYTFNKPTSESPVCYTYGASGEYPVWAKDGFFVSIPTNGVHAGGMQDLGSNCDDLNNCIDDYLFGITKSKNNIAEAVRNGETIETILSNSIKHNEFLCSNGEISAFYTNDINTMNKAYLELAEKYNIPIINLKGIGKKDP